MLAAGMLNGCVAPDDPGPPVVDAAESMTFLEAGLRPEVLLFPDYMLMEDFELSQHGRIPETRLIGAGMRTKLGLRLVRNRFSDELLAQGWTVDKVEIGKQSFRLMAKNKGAEVEIRAVQGTGPTQVFLLYLPEPKPVFNPTIDH